MLAVLVEVVLRTEWKENFLGGEDDVVDRVRKVGVLAGAIGS